MLIWLLVGLAAAIALAYRQAAATLWLGAGLVWLAAGYLFNVVAVPGMTLAAVLVVLPALSDGGQTAASQAADRQGPGLFRTIMPAMSDTERAAIESGTVWWDAELFSGKPNWQRLLQAAGQPERRGASLPRQRSRNPVRHRQRLGNHTSLAGHVPEGWQYTKEAGFLGMIIPKQYGGKVSPTTPIPK